jgi:hypothetical protein
LKGRGFNRAENGARWPWPSGPGELPAGAEAAFDAPGGVTPEGVPFQSKIGYSHSGTALNEFHTCGADGHHGEIFVSPPS